MCIINNSETERRATEITSLVDGLLLLPLALGWVPQLRQGLNNYNYTQSLSLSLSLHIYIYIYIHIIRSPSHMSWQQLTNGAITPHSYADSSMFHCVCPLPCVTINRSNKVSRHCVSGRPRYHEFDAHNIASHYIISPLHYLTLPVHARLPIYTRLRFTACTLSVWLVARGVILLSFILVVVLYNAHTYTLYVYRMHVHAPHIDSHTYTHDIHVHICHTLHCLALPCLALITLQPLLHYLLKRCHTYTHGPGDYDRSE